MENVYNRGRHNHMNLTFVRNRVRPVRIDIASILTISTDDQKAYALKTSLSKEMYCANDMIYSSIWINL